MHIKIDDIIEVLDLLHQYMENQETKPMDVWMP